MVEKNSALYSQYIIDGIQQELTPSRILDEVTEPCGRNRGPAGPAGTVIDERMDPGPDKLHVDPSRIFTCLEDVINTDRRVPVPYAGSYTRLQIAVALIDGIRRLGHFGLDDLCLSASWKWNTAGIGAMAAFYDSVCNAGDYVDSLGLSLSGYSYGETDGDSGVTFSLDVTHRDEDDGSSVEQPFTTADPRMAAGSIASTLQADPASWIVYVPFETSDYRLGGSLLAQAEGVSGGAAVQIEDPDYFMDCYEVVRELVEDGIVISAATVGDGGLIAALRSMTTRRAGMEIDLSEIRRATSENDPVRILFSEVPGIVIQINDADFDYLDAELLLQDVAFYPLGHPVAGNAGIRMKEPDKSGIQTILEALIRNQGGEGED